MIDQIDLDKDGEHIRSLESGEQAQAALIAVLLNKINEVVSAVNVLTSAMEKGIVHSAAIGEDGQLKIEQSFLKDGKASLQE